jgi:hypothetical protein
MHVDFQSIGGFGPVLRLDRVVVGLYAAIGE